MTRIIAGTAGGPAAGRPDRPGDQADQRPGARRAVRHRPGRSAAPCDGPRSSTCTPGPARSAWRRCRAARPTSCWSSRRRRRRRVSAANIEALGLPGAELVAGRVERVLAPRPAGRAVRPGLRRPALRARPTPPCAGCSRRCGTNGWLAPARWSSVERATRRAPVRWPAGYAADRARRYGEGTFWYGRAAGAVPAVTEPRPSDRTRSYTSCAASSARARSTLSPTDTSTSSAARRGCTTRSSSPY